MNLDLISWQSPDRQTLPSVESCKINCLQALHQHIKDRPFKSSLMNNKSIIQKKKKKRQTLLHLMHDFRCRNKTFHNEQKLQGLTVHMTAMEPVGQLCCTLRFMKVLHTPLHTIHIPGFRGESWLPLLSTLLGPRGLSSSLCEPGLDVLAG